MTLHKQEQSVAEHCPVRDVLARLGDRWTVLVLHELQNGTLRFSELRKRVADISPRMLSQTLRQLEQDGLAVREAYPTIPPRVDYSLTPLGQSFMQSVQGMMDWAAANHAAVRAARRAYVAPLSQVAR